ncbi:MAG: hypothetical protein P4M00_02905 [Azospirillaceae bacterium]|nr:hypothetical protein [Azospirillaceae bacterium]
MSNWIKGGVAGLIGLLSLFVADNAHDGTFYYGGFIFFIAAVLFIFRLIKDSYDAIDAARTVSSPH